MVHNNNSYVEATIIINTIRTHQYNNYKNDNNINNNK